MGIAEIISGIIALIKAIPALKSAFEAIALAYLKMEQKNFDSKFTQAVNDLYSKHDQSGLEEAIGSDTAGKPSPDQTNIITRPRRH